ncbi:MAG: alpha/beta fold hydrolase [Bacteroidota bacterium]|nr:alpha/beta fold hydrolase [Bacteroidota bacterium]
MCFHGYGLSKEIFIPLQNYANNRYTFYSFDLLYHGESKWENEKNSLTEIKLQEIIGAFLKSEKIDCFSLLGFSMGGKTVLKLIELFPKKVKNVFLIAPDGIKTSIWYNLATYPLIFSSLFKAIVHNPYIFELIIKMMRMINLMDKGILKFALNEMNTSEKRKRVYYSWIVYKKLKPNISKCVDIINVYKIQLSMITGVFDKVIRTEEMIKFCNRLNSCNFVELRCGHTTLIQHFCIEENLTKAKFI